VRRARRPYLLMIGTIEPRKNHALALSALEILWEQGVDLSLVIVGRAGWMVEDLIQRAGQHRFLGTKLFLFPGCDDIEIAHLYRNAAGLLLVSKGEGFGLPLVEAAQFGTPLICSRLPVFEEVAGRFATYVDTSSESRLAADLADWLARLNAGQDLASTDMPRLNWEESANQLLRVLLDEQWYVSL
jgi:glycosyltransferase involved in cell wall biosynthesis